MADQQYNSPEDMASSLVSDHEKSQGQRYNSAEDMADQIINGPPTVSQKIGTAAHDLVGSTYDTFFGSNGILTNANAAANNAWGARPFLRSLDAYTNIKDTDGTLTKYAKGFNSVVLRPIAGAADAALTIAATDLTAAMGAGEKVAGGLGELARSDREMRAATGNTSMIGEMGDTVAGGLSEYIGAIATGSYFPEGGMPHLERTTAKARAKAAMGEGEEAYFNTIQPHEEDVQGREAAAQKAGIDPAPVHPTTNTNVDWVARQTNPAAFKEWDAKLDYHDELAQRINQLSQQEEGPHIPGVTEESPELAAAKEAYQENYRRLKELEPEINDAYKHADSLMPNEDELQKTIVEQEEARTASRKAQEAQEEKSASEPRPGEETPVGPSEGLWRAPKDAISDDVANSMIKAGADPEVAQAAGQLAEAHYNARAARFGGRLGTAHDLYKKEAPTILSGAGPRTRGAKVLDQLVNQYRLVVARRMPDGTIKKGEPGQLHVDLIGDDELDRKAVGFVGMNESDMGFATPTGKFLTREEAMDWVKENQPQLKQELMHGGPRNKEMLEGTGYEKEIAKTQRVIQASNPALPWEEINKALGEEGSSNLGITGGKTRFEHEAEVADLSRQGAERFQRKHFGKARTLYQEEGRDTFYSALEKTLQDIKLDKGTAEQWVKTIDNLKGVKKEEIDWSGVKEWLADQKKPVTKGEVLEFIDVNTPDVQEVEKTQDGFLTDEEGRERIALENKVAQVGMVGLTNEEEIRLNQLTEKWLYRGENTTRYEKYALPGGKNYRELLLTLPGESIESLYAKLKANSEARFKLATEGKSMQSDEYQVLQAEHDRITNKMAGQNQFRTAHWNEPNILSHIRFDERESSNGEKVLHIAEVQSDWHQAGRKRGYATPEAKQRLKDIEEQVHISANDLDRIFQRYNLDKNGYKAYKAYILRDAKDFGKNVAASDADQAVFNRYAELVNEMDRLKTAIHRIPDAPFKESWRELSMKRMLRYAVENGFDKLSWDTGQTNYERMQGSKLSGQEDHYDKRLPNFMRSYVKKWGATVEKSTINPYNVKYDIYDHNDLISGANSEEQAKEMVERFNANGRGTYYVENKNAQVPVHSVDITPEMKESVMKGQPLFQKKRGSLSVIPNGRNILRLFKSQNESTPFHELGHQWLEEMQSDVAHPEAPDDLKQDWETVKAFLGVDEKKGITKDQHELWARTFERYLREGVSPSEELKSIFEKLKDWLIKVYKSVAELNAPISDPVRKVFDRLLSEKEAKEEAAAEVKNAEPKETTPENGTELAQAENRPRHKRLAEVKGTGEEVNYGLANRINNVLQENFDSSLTDMDTRQRANFKAGQAKVAEDVTADPNKSYEIAMGNRPAPSVDSTSEMYWNAMVQYATHKKDLQMLTDLSQSRLVKEVTTMAQRLASLRNGYDSTAMPNAALIMKTIEDARNEYYQKSNPSQPGSMGIKTKQPLSVDEQQRLVDLTDRVQQAYLNYKGINDPSAAYSARIKWGNSFIDLKKYVDSLKPRYRSKLDQATEYAGELVGTYKTMQTGIGHLSAAMVQGLGSMSHPEFYKGVVNMLKYFASENSYRDLQAHIITDPWYRHAQSAQLGMTNISTKLNNLEEELGSHLLIRLNQYAAEKSGLPINIMGASSRAFTGYLNYLRYSVFAKSMEAAKLAGENVDVGSQTSKDIAEAINNFTGRANLGKEDRLRNASRALNMLFYAPRKLVGTFEVFNPWQYLKPQSATARTLKFRNLIGTAVGVGSVLMLARGLGAEVNLDPTSNEFGVIKIGKTGLDIMPGFRTALRLIAQEATGVMKTKGGKTIDLTEGGYAQPNRATVALSFLRGKESPFAAILTDKMMNYDPVGNEFNLTRETVQKLTPIFANNFINFMDNDAENGAAWPLVAMSLFGVGVTEPTPEPERQGLDWWGNDYDSIENKPENDLDRVFKEAGVNPSFPARTVKGVKLSDDQYHDYIQMSGQILSQNMSFVSSMPDWNMQSQDDKKKLIRSAVRDARRQAADALGIQPDNQGALDQWSNNPNPGLEPELQQLYHAPEQANPQ